MYAARYFLTGLIVVSLSGLVGGCDGAGQQEAFADEANRPPEGITETDSDGRIIREDPDDWRTAPFYLGKVRLDPAFPNPASGGFVTVPVQVFEFNAFRGGLILRSFDANGRFILLDEIQDASDPGAHIFTFAPALLGRVGLHRLFIFDRSGELVSYGDLQVR